MKQSKILVLAAVLLVAVGASSWAQSYKNGAEGIQGASVPPPGFYWRSYLVNYQTDRLRNADGESAAQDFNVDVWATSQRFIWMTDKFRDYLGGADYGCHVIVPVVDTRFAMGPIHDSDLGFGDVDVSPMILAWHQKRFDWVLAYEVFLPTAPSDNTVPGVKVDQPALPGSGYYTHMITAGCTYYMDEAKTWSVSVLPRYEVHTVKDDTDVRRGDDFHFEWGVGKALAPGFQVGVVGYCQWQVTEDSGSDRGPADRDRVFAAGPEVTYLIKPLGLMSSLRVEKEFAAEDRPEGLTSVLTLTKPF